MTFSILACVAIIAVIGGVTFALVGKRRQPPVDPEETESSPGKLTRTRLGIYIAAGGTVCLVLWSLGILH
jgi:hypothetical protein